MTSRISQLIKSALPLIGLCVGPAFGQVTPATVHVDIVGDGPYRQFVPNDAIGAAIDGYEQGDVAKIYTKDNVRAMASVGFGQITYRLRTELGIETWHWNPRGTWSDPVHKCGYWISDSKPGVPIWQSNGFHLPRRGDSSDQANNDGYSRIDDGDPNTFWKSNPYLCRPFAPEDVPQWVFLELPNPTPVHDIRIQWGQPYATSYRVEYWRSADGKPGDGIDSTLLTDGAWIPFPTGTVMNGHGGVDTRALAKSPVTVKFVRIVMLTGSGTTETKSSDIRDRLGFAIRELSIGSINAKRQFVDSIVHCPDGKKQTDMYVSSTDPWHRSSDLDPKIEQPGFDRVFRNGLTKLPIMMPVGLVYDTPENAVAEIKYLKASGYPIARVEMGEEPDGQYMDPECYAALYVQWAKTLHALDPKLALGGPCFQTMAWEVKAWPYDDSNEDVLGRPNSVTDQKVLSRRTPSGKDWAVRFINYLKSHDALKDLAFFSSEYYFYNDVCSPATPKLTLMPKLVSDAFDRWRRDGVPTNIPWLATEYGYSPYAAVQEVDVSGALLDADLIGHYLSIGGAALYFYGLEPNSLIKEVKDCDAWGNLALWQSDDDREIMAPFAAYNVINLVTKVWSMPGSKPVGLYHTRTDSPLLAGSPLVTAYMVSRPDGVRALMIINKDADHPYRIDVNNAGATAKNVELYQYSNAQYHWHEHGDHGFARPNLPPVHTSLKTLSAPITVPPCSISVVRWH